MSEIPTDSSGPRKWEAIGIVTDILFSIAVPTTLFALSGRWLDRKLGVSPTFLVIGLFLSLGVTTYIVTKKGRKIAKNL